MDEVSTESGSDRVNLLTSSTLTKMDPVTTALGTDLL